MVITSRNWARQTQKEKGENEIGMVGGGNMQGKKCPLPTWRNERQIARASRGWERLLAEGWRLTLLHLLALIIRQVDMLFGHGPPVEEGWGHEIIIACEVVNDSQIEIIAMSTAGLAFSHMSESTTKKNCYDEDDWMLLSLFHCKTVNRMLTLTQETSGLAVWLSLSNTPTVVFGATT